MWSGYRRVTSIDKTKLFAIGYAVFVDILITLNVIYYYKAFNFKKRKIYG